MGPLLLVALVTVVAYWPTLGSGFVAWDDMLVDLVTAVGERRP